MGMHVGDDSVRVRPEWIGREALAALETLGLGPEVEDEVLQAVRAGAVMVDEAAPLSPLVRACLECERPTSPQRLHEMADLVRLMYEHHVRLSALVGKPWFDRLEKLSACNADGLGRDLLEILEDHTDSQWLIVDCAGVLLEPELRHAVAAVLTPWNIVTVEHAVCPARTTTDGFWSALAEAGIDHAVVKVNAIDRLLHERNESFGNLQRLVAAELEVSLRRVADQIDRRRPLIVLADHGFRMSPDGRSWRHGGPSWLERVVPVIELEPV